MAQTYIPSNVSLLLLLCSRGGTRSKGLGCAKAGDYHYMYNKT